ncbi:polysaccharide biosynthesis/export family protein [Urbifossiella limnaea]|nr:polysaccharide biosynthesis/export family protein [Urbifossiella limnaea]
MGKIRGLTPTVIALLMGAILTTGCFHGGGRHKPIVPVAVPRELEKVTLPDYRVEPPDILVVEAVRAIPKPPYKAEPLDVLYLSLATPLQDNPLSGLYSIDPDGTVNLGPAYGGIVPVRGQTIAQIKASLEDHLSKTVKLNNPVMTVTLAQSRAAQRITGPHLVRPDGTIALGTYGSVRVAGMTLAEVRQAVEAQLALYLLDPEVAVDVQTYNSKLYYVILDGAGAGQSVYRLPITGNDTVLDAVSQITGLSAVSDPRRIWVSRPAQPGGCHQIFPVDWKAISECGDVATNYQLLPGDRVFVGSLPAVALDIRLGRLFAPLERMLGVTLLGNSTIRAVDGQNQNGGGGGFGGF